MCQEGGLAWNTSENILDSGSFYEVSFRGVFVYFYAMLPCFCKPYKMSLISVKFFLHFSHILLTHYMIGEYPFMVLFHSKIIK